MSSLRDLQLAMINGLLWQSPRVLPFVAARGLSAERRVAIYRNNTRENFLSTLALAFPIIEQLGGKAWFQQTGIEYLKRHPSRSGNLHFVGERFAAYLAHELSQTVYAYFAEVARLEWAYQEVLVAANRPHLDPSDFAQLAPEEYSALRFRMHPAARLIESQYPLFAIWKAHRLQDSASLEHLDLSSGPSRILIVRRADHVELRELPDAELVLLRTFAEERTLEEGLDCALAIAANADLPSALAGLVRLGALDAPSLTLPRTAGEGNMAPFLTLPRAAGEGIPAERL